MRWSDLFDKPERLAIELSPLGINSDVLVLDIRDVPELRERTQLLEAEGNFAALLLLALQWFGDKRHPQPKERRDWPGYGRTKDWGRLPPLEDATADRIREREVTGEPGRPFETMPAKTFWTIYEIGLAHAESNDEKPSLRAITETTRRRGDLEYVPRDRVTPVVDWIAANRRRARGYSERREIPRHFAPPWSIDLLSPHGCRVGGHAAKKWRATLFAPRRCCLPD